MLDNLQQIHLKLVKINNSKKGKATDDLIGNKIANKITKFSTKLATE